MRVEDVASRSLKSDHTFVSEFKNVGTVSSLAIFNLLFREDLELCGSKPNTLMFVFLVS